MTRRPRSRRRDLLFAALAVSLGLAGLETIVRLAEQGGIVDTRRPDDAVLHVDGALLRADGASWVTTAYAERTMVPGRLAAPKADRVRILVLGGSFAFGTPYSDAVTGTEGPGGPASWLRAYLALHPDAARVEVFNGGAGGATSHRVLEIARELAATAPDALLVATCNNEGALPASTVDTLLRRAGGYRLLARLLDPGPDRLARPAYAPQNGDEAAVRAAFQRNLGWIADVAAEAGAPLILSTLPVNLRYEGLERDHSLEPDDVAHLDCLQRGSALVERGRPAEGRDVLRACADSPEARRWLGLTELQLGAPLGHRADLEAHFGPCVLGGIQAHYAGDHAGAIKLLAGCDSVADALMWTGLAAWSAGDPDLALRALTHSVNHLPRNRCRPGFNDDIRALAASRSGVVLADLDAAVMAASPGGIAGPELFVDTCHMNADGYGLVARSWVEALDVAGVVRWPDGLPSHDAARARLR